MKIRHSTDSDQPAITKIHVDAFGKDEGQEIAELTIALLDDETAWPLLSLVAVSDGRVVGHILFTAAKIQSEVHGRSARILAPLAVASGFQGRGVGDALIKEGLKDLADSAVDLVFVLGDPGYYQRNGFETAGVLGFHAPHPIPPKNADAWMVHPLREGAINTGGGRVRCAAVLEQPHLWKE